MITTENLAFFFPDIQNIQGKINNINGSKSKLCFFDCHHRIQALYHLKERVKELNDKYSEFINEKIGRGDFSEFEKGNNHFAYRFFPFRLAVDFESMLFHAKALLDYMARATGFYFNPKGTPPSNINGLLETLNNNYKDNLKAKEIARLFEEGIEYSQLSGLIHTNFIPPDLKIKSLRDMSTHYGKLNLYFYIYKENGSYCLSPEEALLDAYNEKIETITPSSNIKIKSMADNIYQNHYQLLFKTLDVLHASRPEHSSLLEVE